VSATSTGSSVVREGKPLDEVFPRLTSLAATFEGEGPTFRVHFTKRQGAPVHFVAADDPRETAAVREVDLRRKYYLSPWELATKVGLSAPRSTALRRHLGIDDDRDCHLTFVFGSQRHPRYSDNAVTRMRVALETVDMEQVWEQHRPRRRSTGS
jgi:hypothetical protein